MLTDFDFLLSDFLSELLHDTNKIAANNTTNNFFMIRFFLFIIKI